MCHTAYSPDEPGAVWHTIDHLALWRDVCTPYYPAADVATIADAVVTAEGEPWRRSEAFRAAMAAVGEDDPASCVFVGDRPRDDIYGAKRLGMRAVLVPNSEVPAHDTVVPDAVIGRLAELPAHLAKWA